MNFLNNRTYIYICVTVYTLIAFGWWSILLLRKNSELGNAKLELLRLQMQKEGKFATEDAFRETTAVQDLLEKQKRQITMIWSEGGVLFLGLLWGLWGVNRAFQKEVNLTKQQRNFLLSITHELKSPIASIQLIIQTCQMRKLENSQKEALLNSAYKESERLNELVNNLLLSAKLETSYKPILEDINVSIFLDDIISKFNLKFPLVKIEYQRGEVPLLKADKEGLVSVFTNLLENAVKYSQNQPVIYLKNDFIDNNFVFEIGDNGRGIPHEEKKKIFEKFYRIGDEETRKTKGTGLGLYIVNQIIKAHKGTISVLDNAPNGTIFRFTFPS